MRAARAWCAPSAWRRGAGWGRAGARRRRPGGRRRRRAAPRGTGRRGRSSRRCGRSRTSARRRRARPGRRRGAQKATHATLSRARWANMRSRCCALAGVVGGGGDVEDQRGAGERLVAGRRAGLPDVLAHGQPDALGADVDHGAGGSGLEVALLVEDAVVGQVDLAVDRVDGPVGEYGGGVVDVLGTLGEADDGDRCPRVSPASSLSAAAASARKCSFSSRSSGG